MPDNFPAVARGFLGLPSDQSRYRESRVAILPVPFERTTSWGTGTYLGPHGLIAASEQVELYDEELDGEPFRCGIATLPPCCPQKEDLRACLDEIREAAAPPLADGKFLLTIGGEHSITLPLVEAAQAKHASLGVLQLDAHADLRDEYGGTPYSHACVMRRVRELGLATAAVGIRSLSAPEAALVADERIPVLWSSALVSAAAGARDDRFDEMLQAFGTGTPEPGGADWATALALLRRVFRSKTVVAMDIVELAPIAGQRHSEFLAARLAYKCIGYAAPIPR
jgi:agmatinase